MIPLRDANPTRRTPIVTVALIVVNVAVFLFQESLPERSYTGFVFSYAVTPALITADFGAQAHTLLTSMFLHGGWLHLLSNMLYLWIFGNNIEDRLGAVRFLLFYVVCGLAEHPGDRAARANHRDFGRWVDRDLSRRRGES